MVCSVREPVETGYTYRNMILTLQRRRTRFVRKALL